MLHAFVCLISAAWSPVSFYSLGSSVGVWAYLGLALLLVIDLDDNQTIAVMIWSLFGFIVIGVIAAIVAPDIGWMSPSVEETEFRLRGLAGQPNNFGHYTGLFLACCLLGVRSGVISRLLFVAFTALGIWALFASGSRTIFVTLVLAVSILWLRNVRYGGVIAMIVAGVVAVGLILSSSGMMPKGAISLKGFSRSGSDTEITTLTGRTEIWAIARQRITEKPLFGWGYNGTEELVASSVVRNFEGTPINAHNMYLQLLLSVGFLGALPGFLILGVLLVRVFTRPDPPRDLFMLIILINGLAEADIFATPVLSLLMLFWSIAREDRSAHLVPAVPSPQSARASLAPPQGVASGVLQ